MVEAVNFVENEIPPLFATAMECYMVDEYITIIAKNERFAEMRKTRCILEMLWFELIITI